MFSRLSAQDKNRPMVVLNACQVSREGQLLSSTSGFAPSFLLAGAGAFIGPLWMIGDKPARVFIETLYQELLNGEMLADATAKARERVKEEYKGTSDLTWLAYTVYGHPQMTINVLKDEQSEHTSSSSVEVHPIP